MRTEPTENSTKCISGNNILVLAPNWLGDAVMSLPFISALRGSFPEGSITVSCREYVSEIFNRSGDIDRVLVHEKSGLLSRIMKIRGSAEGRTGYDSCFILPPSFSSALIAFFSGAGVRVGYATDCRKLFLTEHAEGAMYRRGHLVDRYLNLLELSGCKYESEESEVLPSIQPPAGWDEILKDLSLPDKYAVISPGANYGEAKIWPVDNYVQSAKEMALRYGLATVCAGSEKERDYIEDICRRVPECINLAGRLDIRELIAVLKGAELAIGNDSGTVHISAALGVPTVAIFGSTNPEWTAPRGRYVEVLSSDMECSPCYDRECGRFEYAKCFDDIKTEDVMESLKRLRKGS